jgi:integrase
MVTEATPNMITASSTATPCKRGHAVPRTTRTVDGKSVSVCPECVKEDKRNSAARRRAKVKTALEPSRVAALIDTPPVSVDVTEAAAPVAAGTFLAVAREFLNAQADGVAERTATKRAYLLDQLKALHGRPIAQLTTPDYVHALQAIEAQGDRRETAHRAGMLAGSVTAYAAAKGYAPINALPSGTLSKAKVLKPIRVESHAAITDPDKFGGLLVAIDTYAQLGRSRNHPSVNAALRLAPLVFVRPGELRTMEWAHLNFERAEWLIPAERMKMRRPHLVPLSTQALVILKAQHEKTGTGRYVFPQKGGKDKPISENAFREAFRIIELVVPDEHTMHGFRSSASTLLNGELHIDSALVEMQLAHVKGDRIAGIYDRSQRIAERRDLMQRWSDYCDQLRAASAGK